MVFRAVRLLFGGREKVFIGIFGLFLLNQLDSL